MRVSKARYAAAMLVATSAIGLHAAPSIAAHQRLFVAQYQPTATSCELDADGNPLFAIAGALDASNNQVCNIGARGNSANTETYCGNSAVVKQYVTVSGLKGDGTSVRLAQSTTDPWGSVSSVTYHGTGINGTNCSFTAVASGKTY